MQNSKLNNIQYFCSLFQEQAFLHHNHYTSTSTPNFYGSLSSQTLPLLASSASVDRAKGRSDGEDEEDEEEEEEEEDHSGGSHELAGDLLQLNKKGQEV